MTAAETVEAAAAETTAQAKARMQKQGMNPRQQIFGSCLGQRQFWQDGSFIREGRCLNEKDIAGKENSMEKDHVLDPCNGDPFYQRRFKRIYCRR